MKIELIDKSDVIEIENIRKVITEIREKIKNNSKYVNPMNKEFQEDIKKYGFKSGHEYTTWMQNNGILKNPTIVDRIVHKRKLENAGCDTVMEYINKCAQKVGFKDDKERREWRSAEGSCDTRKYKMYVSFDEKNFFWVVVDNSKGNSKLIKNPTEENLRRAIEKSYNSTNVCPICRVEYENGIVSELTDRSILYPVNARHNIDKNGHKMDEWICGIHGDRYHARYDPNSNLNTKCLTHRLTGDLGVAQQLGEDCQETTCIWLGCEDLNKKKDNCNVPIDCSPIPKGVMIMVGGKLLDLSNKIPQIKGRKLSGKEHKAWWFGKLEREWFKEFDYMILYCVNEERDTIERIYFIPKSEITNTGLAIYENAIYGWYKNYRVTDEETVKKVDKIYKDIRSKRGKEIS